MRCRSGGNCRAPVFDRAEFCRGGADRSRNDGHYQRSQRRDRNQWLFSFLSADKRKTYCLYEAPNAEAIRAAARRLGVPADTIVEVGSELGPYAAAMAPLREQVRDGSQPLA